MLDDPGLVDARERFWTAALADERYRANRIAVDHGSGAGAALLDSVVGPHESAALWVADPNPRAQAFHGKHGFVPDGTMQVEDGVREIRMVRASRDRTDCPGESTAGIR